MENQNDANYGQDSPTAEQQPWTPDYQKSDVVENLDYNQNPEAGDLDSDPDVYPVKNRNVLDSASASDTKDGEYLKDEDERDYVKNVDDENEDDDDFLNEEDFEEEGDFQEKDLDYREKRERDDF